MGQPKRALPAPLAERAAENAERALQRHRAEAQALVELIQRRKSTIAEGFYDIGESLGKLREPKMYGALGFATFRDLVERELRISLSHAYRLIDISSHVPRPEAVVLGPARSAALLRLAKATPEHDSVTTLLREGVTLPGRRGRVRLQTLSTREILRAAGVEGRAHVSPRRRVSEAQNQRAQGIAQRMRRALRRSGGEDVSVEAVRRRTPDGREEMRLRVDLRADSGERVLAWLRGVRGASSTAGA